MYKNYFSIVGLLLLSCFTSGAQQMSDAELLQAIKENPYRAAGGHCPYEALSLKDTPAPSGYEAVYVSHYGRHGSRYQGDTKSFEKVLPGMDSLFFKGKLTPEGDSLRVELHRMYDAHIGFEGILTQKGSLEHRGIAERLCHRAPSVFSQLGRNKVDCAATSSPRVLQSMANFTAEVKGEFPSLEITYRTGNNFVDFLSRRFSLESKGTILATVKPVKDFFLREARDIDGIVNTLFRDTLVSRQFVYDIFEAAQGAACLDIDVNPLRFFTDEQLLDFLKVRNVTFSAYYGTLDAVKDCRWNAAELGRLIVSDADAAISGNGVCANFRFGHDGGVGPLAGMLAIEGYDRPVSLYESHNGWPSWKLIPMGTNIQMIYYLNKADGDVLVKILFNEKEVHIPSLKPVSGPYYKWYDLRRYILERIGDIRELPSYYDEYLKNKALQISRLQDGESDGFYFLTDTHFPFNNGNSAAMIDRLQAQTARRKVFFGGDMIGGEIKTVSEGINMQTSLFLHLRGVSGGIFPIRGNHDFTTLTKRNSEPRETFGQIETAAFIRKFTDPRAVFNNDDPGSDYYYFDEPCSKIRYIAFDTTDSVSDKLIVYGISTRQLKWVIENAILTTPQGWGIYFLSHVPAARDHNSIASILRAGDCIDALSSHENFNLDGRNYDFAQRPDIQVLMMLSGHRHSDVESAIGSTFNILTSCDSKRTTYGLGMPLSGCSAPKVEDALGEQTFDYVSISKDKTIIRTVRLGDGNDRIFHIVPLECHTGTTVQLNPILKGHLKWAIYDGYGNKTITDADGKRYIEPSCAVAEMRKPGTVKTKQTGSSIAVAMNKSGVKEFFMLSVTD